MNKAQRKISSKVGDLYLVASTDVVFGVFWKEQTVAKEQSGSEQTALLDLTEKQIGEYLEGKRKEFDLPHHSMSSSHYLQRRAWRLRGWLAGKRETSFPRETSQSFLKPISFLIFLVTRFFARHFAAQIRRLTGTFLLLRR